MDEVVEDFGAYRQADVRFHIGLAEATGSIRLVAAMTDAQSEMTDLIAYIAHPAEVLGHSNDQHARLLAAVRRRDAPARDAAHGRAPARHRARAGRPASRLTAVRFRFAGGAWTLTEGSVP